MDTWLDTFDPAVPRRVLDRLVAEKGLGRHGFFATTDEGERAPDGSGPSSGYVVDECGRTFFFRVEWTAGMRDGRITLWKEDAVSDATGPVSDEERRARAEAGFAA